jgi:drug/metabolite transporter (DMT)-like permease
VRWSGDLSTNPARTARERIPAVALPETTVAGHGQHPPSRRSFLIGSGMALASSTAFGTLPIFGKYAYKAGLSPQQFLAFRFIVTAVAVLALGVVLGEPVRQIKAPKVIALLLMGGVGYFTASITFFIALQTLPASLCELMQFVYPALVAVETWLIFKRRLTAIQGVALALSLGGAALLVGGIAFKLDLAIVLLLLCPVAYSFYLVAGERVMTALPPVSSSGLVVLGAAISFAITAAVSGQFKPPASATQWSVLLLATAITGILAIPLLLAALPRIRSGPASVIGLAEPVVTVLLAWILLGERLGTSQAIGATLVLVAIVLLQLRRPVTP